MVEPPVRRSFYRPALYVAPLLGVAVLGIFYLVPLTQAPTQQSGSLQLVGSETMRPVVSACAEEFMVRNPRADIVVKGGGSGDGVVSLLHGLVDVGMVSRELSKRERDYAASRGIDLTLSSLAMDGVSVIVHRSNAITALELAQISDIFTGKAVDWRDVGGEGGAITVVARAEGSGTAALFGDRVLAGKSYVDAVHRLPTNEAVVAEVARQPGAIGYTGLGALRAAGDGIRVVAVRADAQTVAPTAEAIRAGTYPLARTLAFGTVGQPSGMAKAFIDFCAGAGGRSLLQRAGYVVSVSP